MSELRGTERCAIHAILLVLTIAKVMASQRCSDPATAMLVWNALGLLHLPRGVRVPRAIASPRAWRWPRRLGRLTRREDPDAVARWRPLEPYVLEMRPWT